MKRVIEFLKEHKIETFVATFLFAAFVFLGITISHCVHTIDEAGGFRAAIVVMIIMAVYITTCGKKRIWVFLLLKQ
jgi:hypothetical protein